LLIKRPADIRPSEITDRSTYLARRRFILGTGALIAATTIPGLRKEAHGASRQKFGQLAKSPFSTNEELTSYEDVTTYNNFYEFGTDKGDPARISEEFNPRPWSVSVSGECAKPGTYDLDDLVKPAALEERIYRLRCVEAWSMVIPWVGLPLGPLLKRFEPTGNAKYVEFRTLHDPARMPGQRRTVLKWPYREGLRMDEAMHPLTIFAVGLYGEELPNQNGAPLRLVVPWKYGFKSIKSIVSIRFTQRRPQTSWSMRAASEYGFYSNVNPQVDHPRWSQAKERRIGDGPSLLPFRVPKREARMFNGYAEQVASLYRGMDLRKQF